MVDPLSCSFAMNKNTFNKWSSILEATPHETAAVRPLISYPWNNASKTSKTCGTLLEK